MQRHRLGGIALTEQLRPPLTSYPSFAPLRHWILCLLGCEYQRQGEGESINLSTDLLNPLPTSLPQSNPENTVGVLTMAGKGVRVLVTPTADLGKILSSMHGQPSIPRHQLPLPAASGSFWKLLEAHTRKSKRLLLYLGPKHFRQAANFPKQISPRYTCSCFPPVYKLTRVCHVSAPGVEVAGATNLLYGLQVAQLALKHRQNKNQRQRIVLFAGRYSCPLALLPP